MEVGGAGSDHHEKKPDNVNALSVMQHLEPQIIIDSISPNYYTKSHLMLCKVAVNKDIIIILLYLFSGTVPLGKF